MQYITDLSVFNRQAHNPAFGTLKRQLPPATAKQLVDYYVPINAYFPTDSMYAALHDQFKEALIFYPEQNRPLAEILADLINIDANCLVMANGSTELITWINQLFLSHILLTSIPTFGRWTDQPQALGKTVHTYLRSADNNFQIDIESFVYKANHCQADIVVLCNPNNPTGAYVSHTQMTHLLNQLESVSLVVIDESFIDFVDTDGPISVQQTATERHNVIVIKSLGKCLGLHGARIGYAVSNPKLAEKLRCALPFWNINGIAEMILRQLNQYWQDFELSRQQVIADRQYLQQQLQTLPDITVYPSQANFVYIKLPRTLTGPTLRNHLAQHHGYIIRECSNKLGATEQYCRIAATPMPSTDKLILAMHNALESAQQ